MLHVDATIEVETMAMVTAEFQFAEPLDEAEFRTRLRREVGRRRAGERCVELVRSREPGVITVLSMDGIALAYAAKVCIDMGGAHVPMSAAGRSWKPPEWTATPWTALPWMTRARIWIGPTAL